MIRLFFFFSSRRRHTRLQGDWSSDVCSSDLLLPLSGGEAQQLTDLPKGASPAAWSPDGKTIAFTSTTTAQDLAKKDKDDKDKEKAKGDEPKSDVRIITQAEFRADDEGYCYPAERSHIWT